MKLTLDEARRIAVAAQGLLGMSSVEDAVRRIGVLQIDFVNVLVPAHFLIPYARVGPYDRAELHDLVYKKYRFTEQWAHEASIIPVEHWPLLQYRRDSHRVRPWNFEEQLARHEGYAQWVLDEVKRRGPLSADDLPPPDGVARKLDAVWMGTFPRAVLEAHFGRGAVAAANRLPNYARAYNLPHRIVPKAILKQKLTKEQAQCELIGVAARAHGVATAHDLADYHRMPIGEARVAIAALLAEKRLEAISVEGWKDTAYITPDTECSKQMQGGTFLSPFDPPVWRRPRAERLFHFEYRIEIYTPAEKRRWGYYVLPFLLDGKLVARADLKADRKEGKLDVLSMHFEKGARVPSVRAALKAECGRLADWLGLSRK